MSFGAIPNRWERYSSIGTVVEGTPFLPFKVPLNDLISRKLPDEMAPFRPSDLLEHFMHHNLRVGLIIDLTNTTRYYSSKEFEYNDINYVKIFTEGHAVPSQKVCTKFFDAVDNFLTSATNYNLIGVHCTHGVNRTGYLICRYMIDKLKMKPNQSINAFTIARGHPIERENYINALLNEQTKLDNDIETYQATEPLNDDWPKSEIRQKAYQNSSSYKTNISNNYNDRYNRFNNDYDWYNRSFYGKDKNNKFSYGSKNELSYKDTNWGDHKFINKPYINRKPYDNKLYNSRFNRDEVINYNSLNQGFKIGYDNLFNGCDYFTGYNKRYLSNYNSFNHPYNRDNRSNNYSNDNFKYNKNNGFGGNNNFKWTKSIGEINPNINGEIEKKSSNYRDDNHTNNFVNKWEVDDTNKQIFH